VPGHLVICARNEWQVYIQKQHKKQGRKMTEKIRTSCRTRCVMKKEEQSHLLPPCWRYTISCSSITRKLTYCCGWNYTPVQIHGIQLTWCKNFQTSAFQLHALLTLRIPPTWRRGFMPSSVVKVQLYSFSSATSHILLLQRRCESQSLGCSPIPRSRTFTCSHTATRRPGLPFNCLHPVIHKLVN